MEALERMFSRLPGLREIVALHGTAFRQEETWTRLQPLLTSLTALLYIGGNRLWRLIPAGSAVPCCTLLPEPAS